MEVVRDVVRAIRELRQAADVAPNARVRVALAGETRAVAGSLDAIATLANADVTLGRGEGRVAVVRAIEVRLAVERDATAERARVARELTEARDSLRRSEELLERPGFADKAPVAVVERERAKLEERRAHVALLERQLTK
ncbi:MAG: hypothetical protein HYX56_07515 [Chloroflexi bacterium]|nr:hypothetical protein [Chloroflexota bacterium]